MKHTIEEQLEYLKGQVKDLLLREKKRDAIIKKLRFDHDELDEDVTKLWNDYFDEGDEVEEDEEPEEDDEEEDIDGDEEEEEGEDLEESSVAGLEEKVEKPPEQKPGEPSQDQK